MSLIDYTSLTAGIQNWMQRTDLATLVPDFITLFESFANRTLRVRQQQFTAELTPSNGVIALPNDYLSWSRLTWTGNPRRELSYVEGSWLQGAFPDSPFDIPSVFTIEGGNIITMPIDATATVMEFVYFQKIPGLQANTTNWLMTAHPDLYLFGALTEAQAYAVNVETAALWKARRDSLIDEITTLSNKTRGPAAIRTMAPTP